MLGQQDVLKMFGMPDRNQWLQEIRESRTDALNNTSCCPCQGLPSGEFSGINS